MGSTPSTESSTVAQALHTVSDVAWKERALVQFPLRRKFIGTESLRYLPTFMAQALIDAVRTRAPEMCANDDADCDEDKESSYPNAPVHIPTLLCSLLGEDAMARCVGSGGYGNVNEICLDGMVDCETKRRTICVKCCEVFDADAWEEATQPETFNSTQLYALMHPEQNDATAEPIITNIASFTGWMDRFVLPVLGTMCEDAQYCARTSAITDSLLRRQHTESAGSSPTSSSTCGISPRIPRIYMWMSRLSGEVEWECAWVDNAKNTPTDGTVLQLETVVAQAVAGIISLSDAGVTHNDLHIDNLMYSVESETSHITTLVPTEAQSEEKTELRLPAHNGARMHLIDFGLACAKLPCGTQLGGNTVAEFGLERCGGLNTDLRTLALDLCSRSPRLVKSLLVRLDEADNSEDHTNPLFRAKRFLSEFFKMALRSLPEETDEMPLAYRLFRNMKLLKKICSKENVALRDNNKTPNNLRGKYHIIREVFLHPESTCAKLRRQDAVDLLRMHYYDVDYKDENQSNEVQNA